MATRLTIAGLVVWLASACTLHHSRQALGDATMAPPSDDATFVVEEDSGLLILSVFRVSDADHYAVLLERMRRRHACTKIHHAQLDYYTDYWVIVGFHVARVTALCEHGGGASGGGELVMIRETAPELEPVNLDVTGTLAHGDLQYPDDDSFYDELTFETTAGYTITVEMTSTDFDSYLHLRGPDGEDLEQNDDVGPGDLDARIVRVAPVTGTYTVLANSRSGGETGAYRVRITTTAP